MPPSLRRFLPPLLFTLLSNSAGLIGSIFTASSIPTWYATLVKPSFNPPSWVFGPVWTLLYTLMGLAAFLVWKRGWKKLEVKSALLVFGIQLTLNALWSIIFFGMKELGIALGEIALMWLAIVATIRAFARLDRRAAWLLAPYLAWVTFAATLNYALWTLN
jgi:tryptophan-rich sensory protein